MLLDFVGSQPNATEKFSVLVPFTVTLDNTAQGTLQENGIRQSATIIPTWQPTANTGELTPDTNYEYGHLLIGTLKE